MSKKIKTEAAKRLFQAVLTLETEEECFTFFEDLCTVNELESLDKEDTQFILTIVQYLKRHNSASRRRTSR